MRGSTGDAPCPASTPSTTSFPKRYFEKMLEVAGGHKDIGKRVREVPCLCVLDVLFAVMDQFEKHRYVQVLSLPSPPIEAMAGGAIGVEMARLGTDGMAELVARHPDRFVGYVSSLPMADPEAAAREAERAFAEAGASGLQLYTKIKGKPLDLPEFLPVFEVAAGTISRSCCTPPAVPTCPTTRARIAPGTRSGGPSVGPTRPAPRWRAWCSPGSSTGCPSSRS
jgi:Amidohydrolase